MSEAIRILHIVPRLVNHGAEQMVVHLITSIDRNRFLPAVISLYDPGGWTLETDLQKAAVPVWYLGKRSGFDPRMFSRVSGVFSQFRPTLTHTHLGVLRYVLPAITRHKLKSAVHTVHTLADKETEPTMRWVQRLAFRWGVQPVAVSQEVRKSICRTYGLANCVVVSNGIPLDHYDIPQPAADVWRCHNGFTAADVLLTCVGRFDSVKNHSYLIDAFARVVGATRYAHLVLAGEGQLESELRHHVRRLNLSDRVHFIGHRADVPTLLKASDMFVLSSWREGNPLCVLEAMASGLPVIGTAVGGLPELINPDNGLLVPLNDPDAFARAMLRLIDSAPTRHTMSLSARARAAKDFSLSKMAQAYSNLYCEIAL